MPPDAVPDHDVLIGLQGAVTNLTMAIANLNLMIATNIADQKLINREAERLITANYKVLDDKIRSIEMTGSHPLTELKSMISGLDAKVSGIEDGMNLRLKSLEDWKTTHAAEENTVKELAVSTARYWALGIAAAGLAVTLIFHVIGVI
jgi:hypothetical protein